MPTAVLKSLRCDPRVVKNRVRGIRRVSITGDKRFISAFMHAVKSPCEKVRAAGVRALGKRWTWTPGRRALLLKMLSDSSYKVRAESARGLGKLGDPTVASYLEWLLKNDLAAARRSTRHANARDRGRFAEALIDSLEKLKGVDVVHVLLEAVRDPDLGVYRAACWRLKRINARQPLPKWVLHRLVRLLDTKATLIVGKLIGQMRGRRDVVHKILPLLTHGNGWVYIGALNALKGLEAPRVINSVLPLAYDESHYARMKVMQMLGLTGDKRFLPVLRRGLKDPEWPVRIAAAVALARIGGLEAFKALSATGERHDMTEAVICYSRKALMMNALADLFINPFISLLTFNLVGPVKVDPGRADELIMRRIRASMHNFTCMVEGEELDCPSSFHRKIELPPDLASCIPSTAKKTSWGK